MSPIPPVTSGTSSFFPSNAAIFLEAFANIGIFPPAVTRSHMFQAYRSLGFLFADWQNRGVNLWEADLQTINLTTAATYLTLSSTVAILDMYYRGINSDGSFTDRIMVPMSRSEYAEIPNKLQAGIPTRYWYQKLQDGTQQVTIWQPPLSSQVAPNFLIQYYRLRRTQDAFPTMGQQPDVVSRALDALQADLSVRTARKYKPELIARPDSDLKVAAQETWNRFAAHDRDDADMQVQPQLGGYWRS